MKIVVLDRGSIGYDTPLFILEDIGDLVWYDSSNATEALERVSDAEVLIINKVKVTRELLSAAKKLKLVCVFATGYDNIDIKAARELGIGVCNVPAYSTDSVCLYTISTVLVLCSRINEYSAFVKDGEYTQNGSPNRITPVFHDLKGKKWGIIGYGNIGKAVARVAEAMGADVLIYKRTPVEDRDVTDIDTLCRESDIISLHCPLNEDSRGLINRERIASMKPNVILVNEARGAVIDEEAIAKAIEENKIAAFGCDVYSVEPFGAEHPYTRIMDRPNVVLTPHCAWASYEAREKCINIIGENIRSFLNGKTLNRVDKQ